MSMPAAAGSEPAFDPLAAGAFAQFHARAYLLEYYSHLGAENRALMRFLQRSYATIFTQLGAARLLEFGGGPTIYQLISAARYPVKIDFSDYLSENLAEVRSWLDNAPGQFDWDAFVRYALASERQPSGQRAVERRKRQLRERVGQLLYCDAKSPTPLGAVQHAPYDIVGINFVLESITQVRDEWYSLLDHVVPLVRPHGYMLMCAILGATHYRVGQLYFPAVPISQAEIREQLARLGFSVVCAQTVAAEHREQQGYDGIAMVLAKKGARA